MILACFGGTAALAEWRLRLLGWETSEAEDCGGRDDGDDTEAEEVGGMSILEVGGIISEKERLLDM